MTTLLGRDCIPAQMQGARTTPTSHAPLRGLPRLRHSRSAARSSARRPAGPMRAQQGGSQGGAATVALRETVGPPGSSALVGQHLTLSLMTSFARECGWAAQAKQRSDPSPFFEPLLRSFLLGLSAGAAFESLHVFVKFFNLMGDMGYRQFLHVWPQLQGSFSPLFMADHFVSVGSWILFYVIEAAAIYGILNHYPNDKNKQNEEMTKLVTLPRRMLPVRLQLLKQLLLGSPLTWGSTLATATSGAVVAPPGTGAGDVATVPTPGGLQGGGATLLPETPPNLLPTPPPRRAPGPPPPPEGPEDEEAEQQQQQQQQLPPTSRSRLQQATDAGLGAKRAARGLRPGQLDPAALPEPGGGLSEHRRRELAGRRAYLRNFWYAAGISDQVRDKPVGVEILGEKLLLFRDSTGQVHCLNDVCPHRGAPLHMGWVAPVDGHDCVVCPYHGWAFDAGGVLRDVPAAEGRDEFPHRPLVDAFPVEERGGFIWLFYGSKSLPEAERPPIPAVPELSDPAWKPVYGEIEFECNHWSVFENAIDMAHIHYLHNDTFGNQGKPQIRGMTSTSDAYGVTAQFRLHNKPVNALWEFSKVQEVAVTAQALLPSTSVIAFTLGNGLSFTTFVNTVPINEHRTVNRFALIRKLALDKTGVFNAGIWDKFARDAMLRILSEDKAMVETLRPDMLTHEFSVRADLPQISFRKLRQEYLDLGYGVLPSSNGASPPIAPDR